MKQMICAFTAVICAALLLVCAGCAPKQPEVGQPVSMDAFTTVFNEQMAELEEKISLGKLEQSEDDENLYVYWFANPIMIRVYTKPGTTDIVSFSVVSDHETVGLKTEMSALLSGMMALDPSIGIEGCSELLNDIFSGAYNQSDGSAIRSSEWSEYALANEGGTLFLSGRLTQVSE